jgi:hypothetical protein
VPVGVAVAVGVAVGVCVAVAVGVNVGVAVGVTVAVGDSNKLGVGDAVGVGLPPPKLNAPIRNCQPTALVTGTHSLMYQKVISSTGSITIEV